MSSALRRLVAPIALLAASFAAASNVSAQAPDAGAPDVTVPKVTALDSPARLRIASLPNVLDDEEVARHLATGLTSSFLVTARVRGQRTLSASLRIDIRYELWDEVYLVETDDPERPDSVTLDSPEALANWWQELTLDIPTTSRRVDEMREVDVSLSLVPFSEAERRDTELWYSGSARSAEASSSREGGDLGGILELVTATSIRRDELLRYDWRVTVGSARAPRKVPRDPP